MTAKYKHNHGGGGASWRIGWLLLSPEAQRQRVRALSESGWSDASLATLTGLGIHEIRVILDPHDKPTDEEKPT